MLLQATQSPDFINYLVYLFSTQEPPPGVNMTKDTFFTVRYSAGINLKNKLRTSYQSISPQSLDYIRSAAVIGLRDENPQIRSFAGVVITEMVSRGGLFAWPQILQQLLSMMGNEGGNESATTQEAALNALTKVCEDNRKVLDKEFEGQRPLSVILPKMLEATASPNPRIRGTALNTIKNFITTKSPSMAAITDALLERLFQLANDESTLVRKTVCQCFVNLVEVRPEKLAPYMEGLVDYILMQQQGQADDELALEAAEFWLTVGEHEQLQEGLRNHLHKIVPVLLASMVYDEEDQERLSDEADDADQEDRAEDLKPQFAKSKAARFAAGGKDGDSPANGAKEMADDDLSDGEIEDSDEEDGDPEERWNLRKCSAAALDVLATVFNERIFEIELPYLKENLGHADWPKREAAVLALGAIADGCMSSITPHLPELVPYLISLLTDRIPVVRQITCWCLGRYSEWASHLQDPADKARFFEPMMDGILKRMLDNTKRVQEAAASSFANLEEKADANLIPYCEPILRQFVQCFARYKDRNMFILYDCVQTLADHVGQDLARPELVDLLMPALIDRWHKVSDQSRELFPLLECLGYVATAYGDAFSPFVGPIFARCVSIIFQNLQDQMAAASTSHIDEPDKDFLITSIDLLSSIIQAIDPAKSGELVASCQPKFFELLSFCMEDSSNDVRQSSYALLGDCAINIFPQLQPFLPNVMPALIKQLNLNNISDDDEEACFGVLNNTCWSCGEIATHKSANLAPYFEELYAGLLAITTDENVIESVNENAAMALGRLGFGLAEQLAPRLSQYAPPFLASMVRIDHTTEKASAFLGFNEVVRRNPQALEACLGEYFQAIAIWPAKSLATGAEEMRAVRASFEEVFTTLYFLFCGMYRLLTGISFPAGSTWIQGIDSEFRPVRCYAASCCSAEVEGDVYDLSLNQRLPMRCWKDRNDDDDGMDYGWNGIYGWWDNVMTSSRDGI